MDTALDGPGALSAFRRNRYDVVLLDLGLPGKPGDVIVTELNAIDPGVASVLITGWNLSEDDARLGLFDFHLAKPFTELDRVMNTVARALQLADSRRG